MINNIEDWRFIENEMPKKEGVYRVLDNRGQTEDVLYGSSGFMNEPVSFFDGKNVKAKDIIAFRNPAQ